MDIQEAYSIFGVDKSISDENLKDQYKELAKKYHPDIFKDDPEKFKNINAAYQTIKDHREHPEKYQQRPPFGGNPFGGGGFGININDLFNNFQSNEPQPKQIHLPPIVFNIDISFNESVLGVSKELKYIRCIKCDTCNGVGYETISNGCTNCNGFGRITQQNGHTIFTTNCLKCQGRDIKRKDCNVCGGKAIKDTEISGSVNIPPGTKDGDILRLQGAGHYTGSNLFGDAYDNAIINIRVAKENNMTLIGNDVVSNIKLSMYDAMIGCKRNIKTILGNKDIDIISMSRNKDEIKIPGCGVANTDGTHRIVLDVEYPTNKDELIEFLKEK